MVELHFLVGDWDPKRVKFEMMLLKIAASSCDFLEYTASISIHLVRASTLQNIAEILYVGIKEVEVKLLKLTFGNANWLRTPIHEHVTVLPLYMELQTVLTAVQNVKHIIGNYWILVHYV